jgi:hypothetical protein
MECIKGTRMPVDYCWEIWYDDVFLGYSYAHDADTAISKSLSISGVASMYRCTADELTARSV